MPTAPDVPRPLAAPVEAFWGALSALRGRRRIFHPHGVAHEAELHVVGDGRHGVPLLDAPGRHRAVVRLSRGAGLPDALPDTLGLAVRLCDVHGPGLHQDLLMNTSADVPLAHHLILPAPGGWFAQSYSSVLPYRVGAALRLFGALPASPPPDEGVPPGSLREVDAALARGGVAFHLALAPLGGRFAAVAHLTLGERLPARVAEEIRFNPWNTGGGIRPAGPFQGTRRPAYRGSQRGRVTGPRPGPG